jgi:indolepyruvate ferredoxin oxidoreductase alpha subunit
MHSSQNEQDSRYYFQFAHIFGMEPSNQQEAYDMTLEAFDISEEYKIPVGLRLVTRLSHSRSAVTVTQEPRRQNELSRVPSGSGWTLLPSNARNQYQELRKKQPGLIALSEKSRFNKLQIEGKGDIAFIVTGIAYNYFLEVFGNDDALPPHLKISTYPAPASHMKELISKYEKFFVIEEGYPFIERFLSTFGGVTPKKVMGKFNGYLPPTGEMTPNIIAEALKREDYKPQEGGVIIPQRPPALCKGCPHADSLKALREAMDTFPQDQKVVFSDIGCYTLGYYPPYEALESCVCMGASVSMGKGAADCGMNPVVSVLGDSTFVHSGMTPLIGAAKDDSTMTVLILDNSTVAMTGGQMTMAEGDSLVRVVHGLGVPRERIQIITALPKHHEENKTLLKEAIGRKGLDVVIARRECVQTAKKKK